MSWRAPSTAADPECRARRRGSSCWDTRAKKMWSPVSIQSSSASAKRSTLPPRTSPRSSTTGTWPASARYLAPRQIGEAAADDHHALWLGRFVRRQLRRQRLRLLVVGVGRHVQLGGGEVCGRRRRQGARARRVERARASKDGAQKRGGRRDVRHRAMRGGGGRAWTLALIHTPGDDVSTRARRRPIRRRAIAAGSAARETRLGTFRGELGRTLWRNRRLLSARSTLAFARARVSRSSIFTDNSRAFTTATRAAHRRHAVRRMMCKPLSESTTSTSAHRELQAPLRRDVGRRSPRWSPTRWIRIVAARRTS